MTDRARSIPRLGIEPPGRMLIRKLARFLRDKRQYDSLDALSDHMLRDIGLTRADVSNAQLMNRFF